MGQAISKTELAGADIVIRPNTIGYGSADFARKHEAILEGEKAAQAVIPFIRQKIQKAADRSVASGARH